MSDQTPEEIIRQMVAALRKGAHRQLDYTEVLFEALKSFVDDVDMLKGEKDRCFLKLLKQEEDTLLQINRVKVRDSMIDFLEKGKSEDAKYIAYLESGTKIRYEQIMGIKHE